MNRSDMRQLAKDIVNGKTRFQPESTFRSPYGYWIGYNNEHSYPKFLENILLTHKEYKYFLMRLRVSGIKKRASGNNG